MNGGPINRAGLTLKQNLFVGYYLKTLGNGQQSAKLAGYRANNNVLRVIASQNLTKRNVQKELQRRVSKVISSEEVLEKLSGIINSDVEFKGSDVVKCTELMAKHYKLITDKVETELTVKEPVNSMSEILKQCSQMAQNTQQNDDIAPETNSVS